MKKKSRNIVWLSLMAIPLIAFALAMYGYLAALLICVGIYAIHAVFFTDHIYYNPTCDYDFSFEEAIFFKVKIHSSIFSLVSPLPDTIDTCILPVRISSNYLGYVCDPYVELSANGVVSRQYFERGAHGKRFLNLSRFKEILQQADSVITISAHFCKVENGNFELSGFSNVDYRKKRVLIISPHADDAELSAFAFYKHTPSVLIATITAGEVDAKPYEKLAGNKKAAGLLKGRLRAWDSIAIPLWAGTHVQTIHLGYFCMTLAAMHDQPSSIIPSLSTGEVSVKSFRVFNQKTVASDAAGTNSWSHLMADLTEIITEFQPEIIVTPHPVIDPQPDHIYSTRAIAAACEAVQIAPQFLLYANHYHHTDMYPFGLEHSDLPLPPHFNSGPVAQKLYSLALSNDDQIDKVCALQMMHDLNRPTSFKKQIRRFLQRLVGRSSMPYGDDEYLRKAIRQQELFWVASMEQLQKEFN